MEYNQTKKRCEKCLGYFSEAEMDIVEGEYLCNDCEQEFYWDD